MLVQLVESVAHCHALGIVHRDLKPENVMQAVGSASDQPLLKLCDFGQAAMISGGEGRRLRRKCGTEQYMAPEVLDAELGGALGCERTQPPTALSRCFRCLWLDRQSCATCRSDAQPVVGTSSRSRVLLLNCGT